MAHIYRPAIFRSMRLLALLGLVLTLGSACSNRSWTKLSPSEVREILPELTMLKAYLNNEAVPDSVRYVSYYAFFQKHNITQEDWDSTMYWYAKNDINLYHNFYSRLDDSIRRLQIKLQKKVDALDRAQRIRYQRIDGRLENANLLVDTIYPKFYRRPSCVLDSFLYEPRIPFDTTVCLSMNLDIKGLSPVEQDSLIMSFKLYREGKLDTLVQQTIKSSGVHQLTLSPKKNRVDSISASLSGFLSNEVVAGAYVTIDSLSLIRLPRQIEDSYGY